METIPITDHNRSDARAYIDEAYIDGVLLNPIHEWYDRCNAMKNDLTNQYHFFTLMRDILELYRWSGRNP